MTNVLTGTGRCCPALCCPVWRWGNSKNANRWVISQNAKWLGEVMGEAVSTFKKLIYSCMAVIRMYPVKPLRGLKAKKKKSLPARTTSVYEQHVNHSVIIGRSSRWKTMQIWLCSRLNGSPCWRNKLLRYRRDVLSPPDIIKATSFVWMRTCKWKPRKDSNLIAALSASGRSRLLAIC